jgi:hypothetical protein
MEAQNPGRGANQESLNSSTFTTYSYSVSDNHTRKVERTYLSCGSRISCQIRGETYKQIRFLLCSVFIHLSQPRTGELWMSPFYLSPLHQNIYEITLMIFLWPSHHKYVIIPCEALDISLTLFTLFSLLNLPPVSICGQITSDPVPLQMPSHSTPTKITNSHPYNWITNV